MLLKKTNTAFEHHGWFKLIFKYIPLNTGCGFLFYAIILDFATGPTQEEFYDNQVCQSQGHTGIFAHHYYITGKDEEGNTLQFIQCP